MSQPSRSASATANAATTTARAAAAADMSLAIPSRDGMERLELTDLWTGEMRTAAYISSPTEPAGKIDQDHGHPAGSPDGTKVLFHSCYDLLNHRLYAVPSRDVRAGDAVIPVTTTEGFAPSGKLLVGHAYAGQRMAVSYQRRDATHFYECNWGENAVETLNRAIRSDILPEGSLHITDAAGRLFADGECRPRKEYVAVVKQPDPPRCVAAKRVGGAVHVRWEPPSSREEIAGYVVWRRSATGPSERLTPEPITVCEYVDQASPATEKVEYFVRAVEHCGLYGSLFQPGLGRRRASRGRGRGLVRCPRQRLRRARPTPRERLPPGPHLHSRGRRVQLVGSRSSIHRSRDAASAHRQQASPRRASRRPGLALGEAGVMPARAGEHLVELARSENDHLRAGNLLENPGFENGLDGWTCDESVTSIDSSRAHAGKRCVKLSGRLTGKRLSQSVNLEVKPEWSYRLSFWLRGKFTSSEAQRYNGPHPNTLGRIATLLEPLPYPREWFRNGNRFNDEQWRRVEVVFDTPRREPGAAAVRRVTALPFWCAEFWGEQVGAVWVDDVSVEELGPRLRPVKATKILATNIPGYSPTGLDGRDAHRFPEASLIRVADLRQTAGGRSSISLAWAPARPGVRGYNVYLCPGPECPATKYFQTASVWGKTTVTIDALTEASAYTVKVTAINEDGIEGPAAIAQAAPARDAAAATHDRLAA